MPTNVAFSPLAVEDMHGIFDYIAEQSTHAAAEKAMGKLLDRIDLLASFPESGTPLDAKCIIHSNYRFVISGHYLAFYRIEKNAIRIDRVLDSRSDYLRKLLGLHASGIDLYQ